jgi:ABC-2 type transport system permease protein
MRSARAVFRRDFTKFIRSLLMITMIFIFPLIIMIIFGNTMGSTLTHLPVGLAQEDPSAARSTLYTRVLSAMQEKNLYSIIIYTNEKAAKAALADGRIYAAVIFQGSEKEDETVRLYLDTSQYAIPGVLESGIQEEIRGVDPQAAVVISRIYGNIKYFQFFGVAVIVLAIFMSTLLGGGTAIIHDRETGILEGYFVTPVKRSRIIMGLIASGTLKAFLSGCFILAMGVLLAGVVIRSLETLSSALLVILLISVGLTSFVVSFAIRFSNQTLYHSAISFFNLLLFLTSGALYPTEGMPWWLVWISWINPETYSLHALRCILLKGQGLGYVTFDLLVLSLLTLAAIAAGILAYPTDLEFTLEQ